MIQTKFSHLASIIDQIEMGRFAMELKLWRRTYKII